MSKNSFCKVSPLTSVSPAETEQVLCAAGMPQPAAKRSAEGIVTELVGVGEKTTQSVKVPPVFGSSRVRELRPHPSAQRKTTTVHNFGIHFLQHEADKHSQLRRSKCFLMDRKEALIARAKSISQKERVLSGKQLKAEKIAADIKPYQHLSVTALEASNKTQDAIRKQLRTQEADQVLERYKKELSKNLPDLKTNLMRVSEEVEEFERKARALEAQEQELDMKEERLRERRDNMEKFGEEIMTAKAQHDKVSRENEAINNDLEAAASGQAQTKINNQKIKQLEAEYDGRLAKIKEWEERAAKKSGKNTGRLQQLQAFRKKRLEQQEVRMKEKDQQIPDIIKFKKQQEDKIQQKQNQLHKKAANYEHLRAETEKWELQLEECQASRTRAQCMNSQVTAGIETFYERLAGTNERTTSIKDAFKQLDMIQNLIQLLEAEVQESKNVESEQD